MRSLSITFMELLFILLAATIGGQNGGPPRVICHYDNEAAVTVINKASAEDPGLAQLFGCISVYFSYFHFTLHAQHVSGHHNQTADTPSRNNLQLFSRCVHKPGQHSSPSQRQ